MDDILQRLEAHNEFCESAEARQIRKDAAEEIRKLRAALAKLNAAEQDRFRGLLA